MGVLDARVLLLFAATFSASASAAVILANVKCDAEVINFGATTLSAACGGSLSAELRGVPGEAGGAYSLRVLMPSTPLVLLSEIGQSVVTTVSLSDSDLPAEGEMSNTELTGNMPPTQLCGTGYLVVVLSDGQTISQQLLSGPIPCSDEVVDLMWEFPDEGMPAITVTPGQPIDTDLILKLKNSGTTGLQSRLPLDSPEVKIIVAGEGTVPHYFLHETNMSMAEMSTSLLQTMRHLLLDGAPDTLVMMGRASGAEMLLVADDLTKSRDLEAGSTIDLDLSTLTVSPMKTFSYSYGLPGALIIVADPFNRTNDVDRSNNFAVLLVNFTSSDQGFGMDDAQNSMQKTCKVIPSVEDGGRSALLVSMHSMPYSFDDKTFGFSMADSKEVHEQLKESLRSDQLLARLQAMERCGEEAYVATGDDPAAAVQHSVMAQLLKFLSSVRADAEKLQVQGDMAAEQHNTTLLIATALEDVFTTALEGDDKSKAFILQILVYKMKSIMMSHGMGMRPGKPMGGKFGPKGRPGRGMGRGSSQGGMPGGMSGFPGGMNGFPGGMNGFPGGMNGFPGGMSGSSGGGMSGPGGGMGSGFAESGQGQTRLNFGRRGGGGNGGRNGNRSERRNGDRNGVDGGRNGGGGRRNRTRTQGPSVSPMTTSTTTTTFEGNGGIDDGLAMAGKSPADWGVQSDGTFRCKNGQLVDMFQIKCDGMKDCDDGSDEVECTGRSRRQSGDDDDDDDDDDYDDDNDDDDDDDFADVYDDFDDNDIDDDDDDDDDDNSRGPRRGQGQRRRGGHDRDRNRQGRNDDDDDDYDDDDDDVIDIFVDVVMEAGDEREYDITIEKFEEALEDIVDENGRLPPAINDILSNSIFEMRGRDKPFSSSPMKKGGMSTLFISFPSGPPRFGSRRNFGGRDRNSRRERRCSPYMKEKLEMKKVVSLMFMQLVSKQPEDMKGFTFLPLSLRRSLKEAFTTIMRTGPPMVFKPFHVALRNNTQLQEMVGKMYMEVRMLPGDAKLETIFDFWRNNMSKVIRDELQGDTEMLELLDLSEQYLDLLKPYLREMYDFSQMMKTMMMDAMPKMKAFLNSRPGAEPSDNERCTRLARKAAEAMQASQMSVLATQSTLFESPFDMVVADQTNSGGPESPVYWRVENQDVLRGERCPLTGTMMWTKVAVCSCKNSFPQPPYFPPHTPFPGFGGMGSGGMGPGGMRPGGMGFGGMGSDGMGFGGMGSDGMRPGGMRPGGMGSDGMGFGGMGSDGMGFGGMGPDDMGQDGGGPGGFRPGRGSSGTNGFGLNGQGMGGSGGRGNGGRGNGGRGNGGGRGLGGFRGGGRGNGFGMGQGGREGGGFGMGQGGGGGGGFGMGQGGFGGDQDYDYGNPNRRNITNYFFDRDDDDDDDDYDEDDNENAYSSSVVGQPVVFPGQNSAPSADVNAIRELIQNALTNPDGSLNAEALGNLLGNQGMGSFDLRSLIPQNPQVPKPGGGNIDMTALQNAIKNIRANKPIQFSGVGSGLAQSGMDISKPFNGINFGRAALQQAKANSAQVVDSQEIKSHLELNRRSEMELEDGTLEVSGEVLVGKERDDGTGFELGSVCDDGWGKEEASVVCNIIAARLSKNSAPLVRAEATATAHRAPDSKSPYKELEAAIKLDGVKCVGNETDILQCQHQGWGEHDCHNNEKASVTCIVR